MGVFSRLNSYIYCYNRCSQHDKYDKEKLRQELEEAGVKLIEYYGKIYMDSFIPQWDYDNDDKEIILLIRLSNFIKHINGQQITKENLKEMKEFGFYFVNIKGYYYLERFNYYELITNAYYKSDIPFVYTKNIKKRYLEYKKSV